MFSVENYVTAIISVSVKFHLHGGRIFGFGVSPKNVFRSHTKNNKSWKYKLRIFDVKATCVMEVQFKSFEYGSNLCHGNIV